MKHVNIRLHKGEFEKVLNGKTEVAKYASNKRAHYLCNVRMTGNCNEPQSRCRDCLEKGNSWYRCSPFEVAVLRKGQTDNYTTKLIDEIYLEERDGKLMFVFKLKSDDGHE